MKKIIGFLCLLILVALGIYWYSISQNKPVVHNEPDNQEQQAIIISTTTLALPHGQADFTIQGDYGMTIAAKDMNRTRFMVISPDNRLFVTDMHDLTDNSLGRIYILSDFNSNTGIFGTKKIYLDHLRNPNSVVFYKDGQGITWLYVALTDKLVRYQYEPGEDAPSHEPQTIATFPGYGLSYKYGGWHLTRTVVTHNDKIYVAVGSSCNSCEEKIDEVRAEIMVMDPDGANEHVFAKGLRNAVGIKWVNDNFYATNMGVDHLGPTVPNEMFYLLKANTDYGWPYCYVKDGKIYGDSTVAWKRTPTDCTRVPPPDAYFEAHEAPLGFEYFDSTFADQKLQDSFLVALHGASDTSIGSGPKIVQVQKNGAVQDFITGFTTNGKRVGRPADVVRYDDHSFLITDDYNGLIYYIFQRRGITTQ